MTHPDDPAGDLLRALYALGQPRGRARIEDRGTEERTVVISVDGRPFLEVACQPTGYDVRAAGSSGGYLTIKADLNLATLAIDSALTGRQYAATPAADLRRIVDCAHVTVEYDTIAGCDAVLIVPFPNPDPDDGRTVALTGASVADIRGVLDSAAGLLDDLQDDDAD